MGKALICKISYSGSTPDILSRIWAGSLMGERHTCNVLDEGSSPFWSTKIKVVIDRKLDSHWSDENPDQLLLL